VLLSDIVRETPTETTQAQVERLVREFSDSVPQGRPLHLGLSLRDDLAIESLSLVSLAVRLGTELGVDIADVGLELGGVKTLGDLVQVAETIHGTKNP
jgi:acyl carrier protein